VPDPLNPASISTLLRRFIETPATPGAETVTLDEVVACFGNRAFGFFLLIFGLPNCFPMPPGLPVLCGIVVMVVALQMLIGMPQLKLPRWLGRRAVRRDLLTRVFAKATPPLEWLEQFSKPRFPLLSGEVMRRAVGMAGLALGIALMAPIPLFGGIPAGIAVTVLGLAFLQRDGLLIGFGVLVATPIALAVTSAMLYAIFQGAAAVF